MDEDDPVYFYSQARERSSPPYTMESELQHEHATHGTQTELTSLEPVHVSRGVQTKPAYTSHGVQTVELWEGKVWASPILLTSTDTFNC